MEIKQEPLDGSEEYVNQGYEVESDDNLDEFNYHEHYPDDFDLSDADASVVEPTSSSSSRRRRRDETSYPRYDRLPKNPVQKFDGDEDDYEPCQHSTQKIRKLEPHVVESRDKVKFPNAVQLHMVHRRLVAHVQQDADFRPSPYKKKPYNPRSHRRPVGYLYGTSSKKGTKNVGQYLNQKRREKHDRKLARRREFERKALEAKKKAEEERARIAKMEELSIYRKQLGERKHELFTMLKDSLHQENAFKHVIEDEKRKMEIIEIFRNDETTVDKSSSNTLIQKGKSGESIEKFRDMFYAQLPSMLEEKRQAVIEADMAYRSIEGAIIHKIKQNGKAKLTEEELKKALNELKAEDDEINVEATFRYLKRITTIVPPPKKGEIDWKQRTILHEKNLREWHQNRKNPEDAKQQYLDLQYIVIDKVPKNILNKEMVKKFPERLRNHFLSKKVDEEMKIWFPDRSDDGRRDLDIAELDHSSKKETKKAILPNTAVDIYKNDIKRGNDEWDNAKKEVPTSVDIEGKNVSYADKLAKKVDVDLREGYPMLQLQKRLREIKQEIMAGNEPQQGPQGSKVKISRPFNDVGVAGQRSQKRQKSRFEEQLRKIVHVQLEQARTYLSWGVECPNDQYLPSCHAINIVDQEEPCDKEADEQLPSTSQRIVQIKQELDLDVQDYQQVQVPKFISPKKEPNLEPVQPPMQDVIQQPIHVSPRLVQHIQPPMIVVPQLMNVQQQMASPQIQMIQHQYLSPRPQFAPQQPQQPQFIVQQSQQSHFIPQQPKQPQFIPQQPQQSQFVAPQPQQPQFVAPQPQQPQFVAPQPQQPQFVAPQPQQPRFVAPQPQQPQFVVPQYQQVQHSPMDPSHILQLQQLRQQQEIQNQIALLQAQEQLRAIQQQAVPPPPPPPPFVPIINPLWNQFSNELQIVQVFGPAFGTNPTTSYQPVMFNRFDREIKQEVVTPPPNHNDY